MGFRLKNSKENSRNRRQSGLQPLARRDHGVGERLMKTNDCGVWGVLVGVWLMKVAER